MPEITIRISDKLLKITATVLASLLLIWIFARVWSSGVLLPSYQLVMYVPDAEGLWVGAEVRLDGMRVGKVGNLWPAADSLDPNRKIQVTLRIEKRFQNVIPDNSTAFLVTAGILGPRYVNIHRGISGSPLLPGGEIRVAQTKEATAADFLAAMKNMTDCLVAKDKSPSKNSTGTSK